MVNCCIVFGVMHDFCILLCGQCEELDSYQPPLKTGVARSPSSKQCILAMAAQEVVEQGVGSINVGALAEKTVVVAKHYNYINSALTRRNSSAKSLQPDAIAGHSDGPVLNLGGVSRVAEEHRCVAAANRGGRLASKN